MSGYDHEVETREESRVSIEDRAGYKSGEAVNSALAQTQAMLAGRARRTPVAPEPPTPPLEPQTQGAPDVPETSATHTHDAAVAVATIETIHEANNEAEVDKDHIETDAERAGYSTSGGSSDGDTTTGTQVAATTDMGNAAHVGETGVVSAASTENLDVNDAEDDEAVAQVRRIKEQQTQLEQEEEVVEDETPAQLEPDAHEKGSGSREPMVEAAPAPPLPERVMITRGEPDSDAVYVRQAPHFDDSGVRHAKKLPRSLVDILRQDLAVMTNQRFAEDLPVSELVTAFIAVQLGVVTESGIDDNTVTAMRAFRKSDHRTGVLEEGLNALSHQNKQMEQYLGTILGVLKSSGEKSRLMENALSYLVTERLDPSVSGSMTPEERPIMGGKYRNVRDRLRRETDEEIKSETYQEGRPIR